MTDGAACNGCHEVAVANLPLLYVIRIDATGPDDDAFLHFLNAELVGALPLR